MAKKVVIASACRTAIGKMGGQFGNTPAVELGSIVIKEAVNRAGIKPEQVDEVMMGCVITAGLARTWLVRLPSKQVFRTRYRHSH